MKIRINKHQYREPTYPMKELVPLWLGRKCIYCGDISGLNDWQIIDMPKSMAECDKSSKKAGIKEVITEKYNCLASLKSYRKE